jgi:hypothetical protein
VTPALRFRSWLIRSSLIAGNLHGPCAPARQSSCRALDLQGTSAGQWPRRRPVALRRVFNPASDSACLGMQVQTGRCQKVSPLSTPFGAPLARPTAGIPSGSEQSRCVRFRAVNPYTENGSKTPRFCWISRALRVYTVNDSLDIWAHLKIIACAVAAVAAMLLAIKLGAPI